MLFTPDDRQGAALLTEVLSQINAARSPLRSILAPRNNQRHRVSAVARTLTFEQNPGRDVAVRGSVIDIVFGAGTLPAIAEGLRSRAIRGSPISVPSTADERSDGTVLRRRPGDRRARRLLRRVGRAARASSLFGYDRDWRRGVLRGADRTAGRRDRDGEVRGERRRNRIGTVSGAASCWLPLLGAAIQARPSSLSQLVKTLTSLASRKRSALTV